MAIYKLEEIFEIKRGNIINETFVKKNKGFFPVISSNTLNKGIFGYINSFMYEGEFITMSADGAYAGTVFFQKGKFSITNVCFIFLPKVKDLFISKYLFYILKHDEDKNKRKSIVGSSRPAVRANFIKNINIFLPSLEDQQKIIDIIEPKENLFIKYSNLVRIDKFENTKKDIDNLIDIIEPLEKSIKLLLKIKNIIKKNLIFFPILKKDIMRNFAIFQKGNVINSKDLSETKNEDFLNFINVKYLSQEVANKFLDKNKYKKNVFLGDVILTLDASVGLVSLNIEGYNGYCYNILPKNEEIYKSQIYTSLISKENQFIINQNAFGTTIKHASKAIDFIKIYFYNENNNKTINNLYLLLIKINDLYSKFNSLLNKAISLLIKN